MIELWFAAVWSAALALLLAGEPAVRGVPPWTVPALMLR